MTMKLPSLDTAEGIVVLALGAFVAYTLYRVYQGASAIGDGIKATLGSAIDTVESVGHAIIDPATNASGQSSTEMQQAVGDSGIDGTGLWPLPNASTDGLGTMVPSSSLPQRASPGPFVVNTSDLTPGDW